MIKTRGNFDFTCKVPTFKSLWCILKTGGKVEADFNRLEIDSPGNIWISVKEVFVNNKNKRTEKNYFLKISKILPQKQEDVEYFVWLSDQLNQISLKRKRELKMKKKQKNHQKILELIET